MKTYKLKLRICSPLQTPLQPDTLFGHLCWSIRYSDGDPALQAFLESYADTPPVVLSGAFPDGFFPAPLLPNPSAQQEKQLLKDILDMARSVIKDRLPYGPLDVSRSAETLSVFEAYDVLKWLRKLRFIPESMLSAAVAQPDRFRMLKQFLITGCGKAQIPQPTVSAHNSINRLTGTSESLYFTAEQAPDPARPPVYQLVVGSDQWDAEMISRRFSEALAFGYGKGKSRGAGHLKVHSVEPLLLPAAPAPNAALLLGPCCPAASDPTEGFWRVETKYGKLGGHWATGDNPFKKPVTMLQAGSVLMTDAPPAYCGRLVGGVSDAYPQVVQYAIAPTLAVHCDRKEAL